MNLRKITKMYSSHNCFVAVNVKGHILDPQSETAQDSNEQVGYIRFSRFHDLNDEFGRIKNIV